MAEAGNQLLKEKLISRARMLAWISLAYNVVEAAFCVGFGTKDGALSLLGFGGDSLIEAASAGVILWRFQSAVDSEEDEKEAAAQKKIGLLLMALAVFLAVSAWFEWRRGLGPKDGLAGTVISLVSLATMFWLYKAKMACAEGLQSPALRADAFCTLSCMWLSGLLLLGSLLLWGTQLAFFDALTTLGMAWLIGREGIEEYEESGGHV